MSRFPACFTIYFFHWLHITQACIDGMLLACAPEKDEYRIFDSTAKQTKKQQPHTLTLHMLMKLFKNMMQKVFDNHGWNNEIRLVIKIALESAWNRKKSTKVSRKTIKHARSNETILFVVLNGRRSHTDLVVYGCFLAACTIFAHSQNHDNNNN